MAERLVLVALDDDGERAGGELGALSRASDGVITRTGMVAGDVLDATAQRWGLSEGMAFSMLARNGWCNSRMVLEQDG